MNIQDIEFIDLSKDEKDRFKIALYKIKESVKNIENNNKYKRAIEKIIYP